MQQLMNIQDIESVLDKYGELIVKKNSKNNVVVMSIEEYKNKLFNEDLEKNLLQAEEDIDNGRVIDAEIVFNEWKTKYGLQN